MRHKTYKSTSGSPELDGLVDIRGSDEYFERMSSLTHPDYMEEVSVHNSNKTADDELCIYEDSHLFNADIAYGLLLWVIDNDRYAKLVKYEIMQEIINMNKK